MSKLLRADFACMWKSRMFWLCTASSIGMVIFLAMIEAISSSPDYVIFEGYTYVSMMLSVFVSMYIGTEYSDGTIRNKITAGHSRFAIYFADFIVCAAASVLMYLVSILALAACAAAMQWKFIIPADKLLLPVMCSFVSIIAYTAVFASVSMLVCSRSVSMVISVFLFIILSAAGMRIDTALSEDEYGYAIEDGVYMDEYGEETMHAVKNPDYVGGTKRRVYLFLNDFLPTCQMTQLQNFSAYYEMAAAYADSGYDASYYEEQMENIRKFPLYSLLVIIAAAASGGFFFRKRNLK